MEARGRSFDDIAGLSWLQSFAQRARSRPAYQGGSSVPAAWRHSPPRRPGASPAPRVPLKQTSLLRFLPPAPAPARVEPPAAADAPGPSAVAAPPVAAPAAATSAAAEEEEEEAAPWWCAHGGAHALILAQLLTCAVRRDGALLTREEHAWVETYLALPVAERALYARLFSRKPCAFRLRTVSYREVPDALAAARALAEAKLLLLVHDAAAEGDAETVELLLACLNMAELRELGALAGVPGSAAGRREQLIAALCVRAGLSAADAPAAQGAQVAGGARKGVLGRLAQPRALLRRLSELSGSVAILTGGPLRTFERCARLLSAAAGSRGAEGGGALASAAAAEMGVLRFPQYRTWERVLDDAQAAHEDAAAGSPGEALAPGPPAARGPSASIFASRCALERHDGACAFALRYEQGLAARDLAGCGQLAAEAAAALCTLARRCALAASAEANAAAGAEGGTTGRCALVRSLATAAAALPAGSDVPAQPPRDGTAAPAPAEGSAAPSHATAASAGLPGWAAAEPGAWDEVEGWAARWAARPTAAALAPGCVLCALLTVHAGVASRCRQPAAAAELCAALLLSPFGGMRRGLWWTRLLIDGARARLLSRAHLEAAVCAALADGGVRTGERLGIERRARRLAAARAAAEAEAAPAGAADAGEAREAGPALRALLGALERASAFRGAGLASVLELLPPPPPPVPTLTLHARPLAAPARAGGGAAGGGEGRRGGRVRYMGVAGEGAACSVEQLVLQLHAAEAGWRGVHCETGAFSALFALLLWEQLFDESVPDVLVSSRQSAPLDLGTDAFSAARGARLEARLAGIARTGGAELGRQVAAALEARRGILCVGLNWARWAPREPAARGAQAGGEGQGAAAEAEAGGGEGAQRAAEGSPLRTAAAAGAAPGEAAASAGAPDAASAAAAAAEPAAELAAPEPAADAEPLPELAEMAACLGGRAVSSILRVLCEDYRGWCRGMPDLVLWAPLCDHEEWDEKAHGARPFGVAKLVEVKSANDRLSDQQSAWLDVLRASGVRAEVCRIAQPAEAGGTQPDPIPTPAKLASFLGCAAGSPAKAGRRGAARSPARGPISRARAPGGGGKRKGGATAEEPPAAGVPASAEPWPSGPGARVACAASSAAPPGPAAAADRAADAPIELDSEDDFQRPPPPKRIRLKARRKPLATNAARPALARPE